MNAQRRKQLNKIRESLDCLIVELDQVKDDEEEAYENMPESLQESERGQLMYENVDKLEDIVNELQNQLGELEDVE